ncbi:T2 family ribonuclease [Aspergillus chevalieri]|uniref:ribonuclease T2 n=1 Tax=Aspergillus chevalieri TaxID=182096 RepID=A0A7R7VKI4_ASPCH|nr:ribonuclease T2-like [Aspergillus chevalieri]BCR86122.1 ribonuclease T2-like [Aspergillus chevalieri]
MHKSFLPLAFTASALAALQSCPSDLPLSCHNTTTIPSSDACCFNAPGGTLLQTQFWDYDPATGPADSWTIHGLWPDNCDGTYQQYCDTSREYKNITSILQSQGRDDLLSYMKTYWQDYEGDDESFWEHEFGKHGTCINTIKPSCYNDYTPQQEVGDYFQKTVDLFKGLDTYKALADAHITPDSSKAYELSAVKKALASLNGGYEPHIGCSDGALSEVWYFFNVRGNAIDGEYEPTETLSETQCPDTVKYPPKSS